MALIPTDQRSQIMLLLAIVALFLGYVAWDGLGLWPYAHSPQRAKINATSREVDSLAEIVRRAKEDLASGTLGGLLEVGLVVRTYVKAAGPPPAPAGRPPARPAGRPSANE